GDPEGGFELARRGASAPQNNEFRLRGLMPPRLAVASLTPDWIALLRNAMRIRGDSCNQIL
ncbi:MAG: hypothetical protein ORO03_06625, partial [Alphaproteobacteria bacterium]|nr:hypothetical protein [Alphaproteobacteria bacterium]